ncbi:biotin--[acetyl-CoA-carboxylase] ligase [Dictyobacter formicarum]|uniref:biotin--[biotin carboxyl-carrier protein] ligase n=1 Tax=Dictyobacter formicarum TaxID=2778368 RepID=A0ABQ3VFQ3_9CHLR|nr:biotin--[acetyl-CoA-carboxylase] ligase [Dictyobacter formicarum]GHO84559.1 bifunctional ligase/repressor BirA [Dictyobacter formicarum]
MDDFETTRSKSLNVEHIRHHLETELLGTGKHIVYAPTVDSTNSLAMKLAREGSEEGVVVLTDSQTAGKGRQGRRWVDIAGLNVLSSTVLRPLFPPYQLVMIASLAVVDTIADICNIQATIKWPNDILIGERKVAGILIETSHDHTGQLVAILGIGVNVNGHISHFVTEQPTLQAEPGLLKIATTLEEASGHVVSREMFIARLLYQIETRYLALQQEAQAYVNGPISRLIREQWRNQLSTLGRTVQVHQGSKLLSGVAEDVNDQGELLLRSHSGECISITWGDIE